MRHITLLLILTLTVKLIYCQATYPKPIVWDGDTVVAILPNQLATLNSQIALLIEYKKGCDSTIKKADEIIASFKANDTDLRAVIINQSTIIENKDLEIGNLKLISKNRSRAWIRRVIYGTSGGAVVGLVAGILIAK